MMQDLLKRFPWVMTALVVATCAVLAATAAGHIIEGKFLSDPDRAPKVTPIVPAASQLFPLQRSKDGSAFAVRNMFCSQCTPPEPAVNADPSSIVNTTLPLQLLATNVGAADDESYATLINTDTQAQGAFMIGDPIPGASGTLKEVHYKYIDFEHNGRVERLSLVGAAVSVPAPAPVAEAPKVPQGSREELQASIDSAIKKVSDNMYEIDRAFVDKVLANPMGVAKGARIVPSVKDGKTNGFKLYAIRPNSVYAKLGLQNGDTLQSINNFGLTSIDQALEVYTKLREASSLEVDLVRRGKQEKFRYSIR